MEAGTRGVGLISQRKGMEVAIHQPVRVERDTWRRVRYARRGLHGVTAGMMPSINPMIRPDSEKSLNWGDGEKPSFGFDFSIHQRRPWLIKVGV